MCDVDVIGVYDEEINCGGEGEGKGARGGAVVDGGGNGGMCCC